MPSRLGLFVLALVLGACSRRSGEPSSDAGVAHTTAATVTDNAIGDAGFISAATELGASSAADAGLSRALASQATTTAQAFDIPAGELVAGSAQGDEGRDPALEPALVPIKLGAFRIDALPYPNDPSAAPTMAASPSEASSLCEERGAHLCTELEWERACKGPEGDAFATGASWNSDCDRLPSRCASGFGVRAMGFMREWTSSTFDGEKNAPVLRGGAGHRCAGRQRMRSRGTKTTIGSAAFRCCAGERNDAAMPPITPRAAFRKTSLDAADLAKIFASVPELARIAEGVKLYSDADVKSILSRSGASPDGITFTTAPILWSPELGVEVLVATGRAKKTSFVVALWPESSPSAADQLSAKDKYRFASSFLLLGDIAPVALAYEPSHKKELRWTTCWGCAGEQGMVSLRDDGRIVIVQ